MKLLQYPVVTGAGGFIGYHMCKVLSSMDSVQQVLAIDLEHSRNFELLAKLPKVKRFSINLSKPFKVDQYLQKASVVFAFAARNGTSLFYHQPLRVLQESSLPILNTINAFAEVCPIVYSSSSEVYAESVTRGIVEIPTREDAMISIGEVSNPRWSYATAKIFGEVAMFAAREQLGMSGAIVRFHNVYGPRMGLDHFIPDFLDRASRGIYKVENPQSTRSFLYVSDAIAGTLATLESDLSSIPIFHLGTNDEIKIADAGRLILKTMGINEDTKIEELVGPEGSVTRRVPDCTKARSQLGWSPRVTLEDGLRAVFIEGWR